jgi:signal transduction histidine kinase
MKHFLFRSLTLKLTLAFLVVSLTGIGLVALLMWGITASEFNRFLVDKGLNDFTATFTSYYQTNGSWVGVDNALQSQGLFPSPQQNGGRKQPPPPILLADSSGKVIIPAGSYRQGDYLIDKEGQQKVAITVDNQVVGYIMMAGGPPSPNPVEARFLGRINLALVLAALGAVIIAVFLGLVLARTITRPVRDLTMATRALAEGHLNQKVQVRSRDELGELTRTFNQMSTDLENSNSLRQQMTADIAHDLRTPLSVITGYLEGLKDGVIKPSPKRFAAMYDEALYLQRLVEDLRTLSLADAGELSMNYQIGQAGELIERLATSFQHQAEQNGIDLKTVVEENLPQLRMDPERMQQALSNLVSNALRYTPEGGEIVLSARRENNSLCLEVKDTGAGISAEMLPHIFERFYRGDDSRQEGGSGLGLAIAKSIVDLQGGRIVVTSEGRGLGSLFSIQFPLPFGEK